MTYTVYHCDDCNFLGDVHVARQWPVGFTKVATVMCDALGQTFELTNHIDSDWRLNDGVTAHVSAARSTSVGDVVLDQNGQLFMVAGCGFTPFTI